MPLGLNHVFFKDFKMENKQIIMFVFHQTPSESEAQTSSSVVFLPDKISRHIAIQMWCFFLSFLSKSCENIMLSKYCPACHNFLHKQGPRPGVIGTLLYYIRWTFSWLMFSELLKQLKWNIAIPQPCPHFHWPAHLAEVRLHPGGFLSLWVSHLKSESKCFTFENVYLGKVKQMQCDHASSIYA